MSENSSSDEEWCGFPKSQTAQAQQQTKCWECGKIFRSINSLMSHYKSHNIKATCYICRVTFRRLTSLSTHLDNVHSPPLCRECHCSFSNVWDLNKHAEVHCEGTEEDDVDNEELTQQRTELKPGERLEVKSERPGTSEVSVEYILGEDDQDLAMGGSQQCDDEMDSDSTSSDTDDEDLTSFKPNGSIDGPTSSSTDDSSDSLGPPVNKCPPAPPTAEGSICTACGRGPFKSMKLHRLHCSGIRVKYLCSLCKMLFPSEECLKEHLVLLYACETCGHVFSHKNLYHKHECPKGNNSPIVLFCSQSMPKACNICKALFTSEQTLLNHVTSVHTSVVKTKLCNTPHPTASAVRGVLPGVSGTAAQSATSSSRHLLVSSSTVSQNPSTDKQFINGKLSAGQTCSRPPVLKPSPSSLTAPPYEQRPLAAAAAPVTSGLPIGQAATRPPSHFSAPSFVSPGTTAATPLPAPTPTIMAMFANDSQEVALMKRMNTGWRSKATYPCRQCGAIFRQPSLIISHRYLHRGRRSHLCQCGRAFKHRLHLLRHRVQHAEAVSYICVNCGETFTGAKHLAKHMKGKFWKKSTSSKRKHKVKRKCRVPFTCDCGQLFFRPSAYIWHQIKNRTKTSAVN
ncbi:uncharacterized protein ACBR49_005398 [Aulostomus maculatus]